MAVISVQANPPTSKLVSVNSSLTLTVSASGSDTATIYRPSKLEGGDYSSLPFLTPQAAIDAIPKFIPPGSSVAIQLTNTSYASTIIDGFYGGGTLYILGGNVSATLTSGNASGTAGTGTTSTGLVRPNASAAWTANDLRGKIVKLSVAGTTHWRAIENNTLTVAQVQSVSNLSATSTYQIVTPQTSFTKNGTTGNCLTVRNCEVEVVLESILINDTLVNYGIYLDNCKKVTMRGLSLVSDAAMTLYAKDCFNISFKDSFLGSAANASIDGSFIADASRLVTDNGMIELINVHKTTAGADALNCSGNALRLINCVYASAYLNANASSATPLYLENVLDFQHTGITGANSSTSYGIEFTRGGHYAISGASITGNSSNQMLIEGTPLSYFDISSPGGGSAFKRGTSVEWGDGYTMSLDRWNIPQAAGAGDQLITYDLVIGGGFKSYGLQYVLSPAYKEIAATASATQGNAIVCGWQRTNIIAATFNAGVRLIGNADIAPSNLAGGMSGIIKNSSTTWVSVYPPTGLSIVSGNSTFTANFPITLSSGLTLQYLIDNNTNYNVAIVDASSGTGDVVGPGSATDNALARFDLATGKLIKNSTAILDNSGNFTGVGTINTFSLTTFNTNIAAISTTVTSLSTNLVSLSTTAFNISTTVTSLSTSLISLSTTVFNIATTVTSLSTSLVSLSSNLLSLSSTVFSITNNLTSLSTTVVSLSTVVVGHTTQITSISSNLLSLSAAVVFGPGSAVDNTIVRYDLTTGKLVQSSGITIDDNNNLYGQIANINAQTSITYTFVSTDAGKHVLFTNASAISVTIPNSLPVGFQCSWEQGGAGQITFAAASGATLNNRQTQFKSAGQYAVGGISCKTNASGTSSVVTLYGDTGA